MLPQCNYAVPNPITRVTPAALFDRRLQAIRPAQCWSLGCQSPMRSGRLKARTCWRRTSGWKSGLDSSAICLAVGYAATGKNQAHSGLGRIGGKVSLNIPSSVTVLRRVDEHRTSNIQHPTSNIERPDKATQSHPKATPKPFGRQAVGNQ